MAETTARQVADNLIAFLSEHGDPVTNLKLQKLLYYAQAWYLALYDIPLFDERIEAWIHGPAVPRVYGAFKGYEWTPITPSGNLPELPKRPSAHMDEVITVYGEMSAYHLERLTHQESPWQNARKGLRPDEPSHNEIALDDMRTYYRARLDENKSGKDH